MTNRFTADYFANRTFYQVQAGALVDNPDQRIAVDIRCAAPARRASRPASTRVRLPACPWGAAATLAAT